MKSLEVKLQPTNQKDQVYFIARRSDDHEMHPAVSLQMPRDVAEYLKKAVEEKKHRQDLIDDE